MVYLSYDDLEDEFIVYITAPYLKNLRTEPELVRAFHLGQDFQYTTQLSGLLTGSKDDVIVVGNNDVSYIMRLDRFNKFYVKLDDSKAPC